MDLKQIKRLVDVAEKVGNAFVGVLDELRGLLEEAREQRDSK